MTNTIKNCSTCGHWEHNNVCSHPKQFANFCNVEADWIPKRDKTDYNEWVQKYIDSVDGKAHQSAIEIITELSKIIDNIWNVLNISPNDDINDIQRLVRIGDILEGVIDEDGKQFYLHESTEDATK